MKISILASGSSGNCIYIENGESSILVDAGLSGKETEKRLCSIGRNIKDISAIIITHDHQDHVKGAGIISRRFRIPVMIDESAYNAARETIGDIEDIAFFEAGSTIALGGLKITTIPSPHDAASHVCLFIENGESCLGIFTDIGFVTEKIESIFSSLDAAVLEFNHDTDMLENGPYPPHLKKRIRGDLGHLSNLQATNLVLNKMSDRLHTLFLAHLSEHNNTPSIAQKTLKYEARSHCRFSKVNLVMTSRFIPTPLTDV
ncbi:MAG: MBL fold metallo-hydrolase [Candidatus Schekmanbacteria bacterium]|nr:MBL fold metallo-hydrolase [Candidatus Schekmanbacteria bacterium]